MAAKKKPLGLSNRKQLVYGVIILLVIAIIGIVGYWVYFTEPDIDVAALTQGAPPLDTEFDLSVLQDSRLRALKIFVDEVEVKFRGVTPDPFAPF